VELAVTIDNDGEADARIEVETLVYALDPQGERATDADTRTRVQRASAPARASVVVHNSLEIHEPQLWGPPPEQSPHLYVAVTTVRAGAETVDVYETVFGIRDVDYDADRGVLVNGVRVPLRGVNLHHDHGALGAAFNRRAAERQLEILQDMGANAIRTAHNPPAPAFLELTDRMGFVVVDEIFDVWQKKKAPLDFHLVFDDWHEADLRSFLRRDRNHPSVILWSVGNEVGEQRTGEEGAAIASGLVRIAHEEDPTRPVTTAMNWANADSPLPAALDVINLNYQGVGIRTLPSDFPAYREHFPEKMIFSSESAAAVSSRGVYVFPVSGSVSGPVRPGTGGDEKTGQVSAYELHAADFGSSADLSFSMHDQHPWVAGEFVWAGIDYLGEPTPYYSSRSSYFGIVDLAGFPKDRYWLYQSRWRPELPMVHILPHWTWPERVGEVTPVHVFTSGDEAELFLNGESLGRQSKAPYQYRLRWDYVEYEPGELAVVAYKDGKEWARTSVQTAGPAARLALAVDRPRIAADGRDLAFVTARVVDAEGRLAPRASNLLSFQVQGAGELVATDNGDPTSFVPFASPERAAFNGLALAIVRGVPGKPGDIRVRAGSPGLQPAEVRIRTLSR
jgi:beta-galactosidase